MLACMLLLEISNSTHIHIKRMGLYTYYQLNYFKCMNMLNERNAQKQFLQKKYNGTVFPLNVSLLPIRNENDTIKMTNINGKCIDNLPFYCMQIGNGFFNRTN